MLKLISYLEGVRHGAHTFISFKCGHYSVDATNATNRAIAKETNETNIQLAREQQEWSSNEQEKQNAWNLDMWNKNNEYNSFSAQLERAKEAGVNPNMALGNSATSTAVQQTTLPNYDRADAVTGAPMQYQNESERFAQIANGAQQLMQTISAVPLVNSQIQKNQAEAGLTMKESDWYDAISSQGLKLSQAQQKNLVSQAKSFDANVQAVQQQIAESKQKVALMNEQQKNQSIKNLWESEILENSVQKLKNENLISEQHIPYVKARILSELGLQNAQIQKTLSDVDVNHADIQRINATVDLLSTQNQQERVNLHLKELYGAPSADAEMRSKISQSKKDEFDSTPMGRTINLLMDMMKAIPVGFVVK